MLKKQIFQDFEIIIVDSGSIDKTINIVEEYNNNSKEIQGKIKIIKIESFLFINFY